jgi:hypothetical protein
MIESGEMPAGARQALSHLFHQTLRNEHIRLPDLTVYLAPGRASSSGGGRSGRRKGDAYAATISLDLRGSRPIDRPPPTGGARCSGTRSMRSCRRTRT